MRLALLESIMKPKPNYPGWSCQQMLAVLCAFVLGPGDAFAYAAFARAALPQAQAPASSQESAAPIPPDQLDSLVAPVALYPDPLLAQVLAASTYPLELMQLEQWLTRNPGLKEKALADAVAKQPWDPSVQSMAVLPDVVKRLTNDIQWTTDLGNAFLAQQADVMNAVQRMRQKAQAKGTLKSTEQQVVQTESVDGRQVIVVEQANPQVVYVPSYDPVTVYGPPAYPYPPIYYPPAGYYAAGAAISFGVGVAMGAFWGGGGWGWGCGWGGGNVTVNNFNNFNRAANINRAGNINRTGTWQHNAAHRGGTPYSNRATANRFGGTTRGDSLANRQTGARQQLNRQGGLGTSGVGNRGAGTIGNRGGQGIGDRGNIGNRGGQGIGNRPGGGLGDRGSSGIGGGGNRGTSGIGGGGIGNRPGAGGGGINRPTQLPSGGDRIGSRDLSRGGSGSGAFGGGSRGFDGGRARSDFNRGSSSFGSRGGGGFNRGGGGGFSRGGGGGARRGGGGGGRRR
jgi:Protein of unknown function (DUF3300)